MADERRLVDANALTGAIEDICWYHVGLRGNLVKGASSSIHEPLYKADDIYKAVENATTVDSVEVVRCRDCVYWTTEGNGYFEDDPHCGNPYGIEGYPKKDDFCSRGVRMCGTQPQREDV